MGQLDEMRIYNRALSQSEIQELSSNVVSCDTTSSYNQGVTAGTAIGKAACKADPASCGITVGGASFNASTNRIEIPTLAVPNVFGTFSYFGVELSLTAGSNPLSFQLYSLTQK